MFFSFLSFFIYFISGSAVIGFLAVAMTLPNVYILSVTFAFFLCFWFHNGKANKKKLLKNSKMKERHRPFTSVDCEYSLIHLVRRAWHEREQRENNGRARSRISRLPVAVRCHFRLPSASQKRACLRTFAPIATAHRYCARKFTRHVMHRAQALRNIINNDREDGHCYSFAWI